MEDENETRKKVFVGFDKRSANRYVLNKDGDVFRPFQQKRGPSKKKNRKRKVPDWRIEMNFVHFFFFTPKQSGRQQRIWQRLQVPFWNLRSSPVYYL